MATASMMPPSVPQNASVLDTLHYQDDVLQLPSGVGEQELDEQCRDKARSAGVLPSLPSPRQQQQQHAHVDPRASLVSFSPSAATISTTSLRSHSIDSRNSFSTDLTSNPSRTSVDRCRSHLFSLPLRSFSRLSSRDGGSSICSSTKSRGVTSTSQSSLTSLSISSNLPLSSTDLSLSDSLHRRAFSVRRGLGRLSMFKRSNQHSEERLTTPTCHRCPGSALDQEPALRLDCGHTVCYEHFLRVLAAVETRPRGTPATCCGAADHYQGRSSFGAHQTSIKFDEPLHAAAMGNSGTGENPSHSRGEPAGGEPSAVSKVLSADARQNLTEAMNHAEFRKQREDQVNVAQRLSSSLARQSAALSDAYSWKRRERLSHQRKQVDDLREAHGMALSKLEEQQLSAEIDLREVHEQEKCNCSLALRHMEGYVESGRTVTQKDRWELEKQYWLRDHLEQRQKSAINIIREQQARQTRIRVQGQEKEMAVLELKHQRGINELDRAFKGEMQELEELFWQRRVRLVVRSGLLDEIWRREYNEKAESKISFPIAPMSWPLRQADLR